MPGRFFLTDPQGLGPVFGVPAPNDAPRSNMSPGQELLVWDGARLLPMRWGIIPVGRVNARGRPVLETIINARSETVFDKSAFEGVDHAVIPVNGWYEWTGEARKKTPWAIRPSDGGYLFFAAITDVWEAPGGLKVPQVAAVTCEPNADVRDVHHRMGVLLEPDDIPVWVGSDLPAAKALMRPWPDGRLTVEKAVGVDWDAP